MPDHAGTDDEEWTLLDFAREGEIAPFIELFKEKDGVAKFLEIKDEYTQATPLHMAAANGFSDLVKFIIENLSNSDLRKTAVNAVNDSGNTPMHWAALTGSLDSVKLLFEAGADPLKKNDAGLDSCYQAEVAGHEELANYLYSVANFDDLEGSAKEDDDHEKDALPTAGDGTEH